MGLAYHPLLYEAMRSGRFELDFVEFPVDLYADPAQAGLLDPDAVRMHQILARWPCILRGGLLSLGSVEDAGDPAPDPRALAGLTPLIARARPMAVVEPIGFRLLGGRDLGRSQRLPYTSASADWIAARWKAASAAIGVPLWLHPCKSGLDAVPDDLDGFAFLQAIAERTACEFAFDVADLARLAAEAGLDQAEGAKRAGELPVGMLTLSGDDEADWILLNMLCERRAPRAIVVRRAKYLFPIDAIGGALRRAASMLGTSPARQTRGASARPRDPASMAGLRAWQTELFDACFGGDGEPSEFAARAEAWRIWRARLRETHTGQQMKNPPGEDR